MKSRNKIHNEIQAILRDFPISKADELTDYVLEQLNHKPDSASKEGK